MEPVEIKQLRCSLKLTQARFGERLFVHTSTVSSWERGRHRPSARNRAALHALATGQPLPPATAEGSTRQRRALGRRAKSAERAKVRPAAPSPRSAPRLLDLGDKRYAIEQADCFDVLPDLAPRSIDAVITDPPYSSGGLYVGERVKSTQVKYEKTTNIGHRPDFSGDQRDQLSWMLWSWQWLRGLSAKLKPGGVIAVFSDWRQLPAMAMALQMADFIWRGIAVWDKTEGARPAPSRPRNQCEFILWGSKGDWRNRPDVPVLPGVRREAIRQCDKHHLTGKPVEVMRWLAKLCPPGGLILDPFAGSGSTGVAALLEGRRFLGVERDAGSHAIAERRLLAAAEGRILDSLESGGQLQPGSRGRAAWAAQREQPSSGPLEIAAV